MMRGVIIIAMLLAAPAHADTVTCSRWLDIATCSSPGGYVSHETEWMGRTNGWENKGSRWTTSRWLGTDTTTVEPPPERCCQR